MFTFLAHVAADVEGQGHEFSTPARDTGFPIAGSWNSKRVASLGDGVAGKGKRNRTSGPVFVFQWTRLILSKQVMHMVSVGWNGHDIQKAGLQPTSLKSRPLYRKRKTNKKNIQTNKQTKNLQNAISVLIYRILISVVDSYMYNCVKMWDSSQIRNYPENSVWRAVIISERVALHCV